MANSKPKSAATSASDAERLRVRLHPDTVERVKYWAQRGDYASINDYVAVAVEEKIGRENGDYDLPALEIQRLNQIIDEQQSLSRNVMNLERVVVNGFDSLLGLTRGDSYLQDAEDGEFDTDDEFDIDSAEFSSDFGGGR